MSGFLKSLKRIFSEICADSERYRNLLAGIFQILTFCGNIVFPLSPVSLSKTAWTLASEGILSLMLEPACAWYVICAERISQLYSHVVGANYSLFIFVPLQGFYIYILVFVLLSPLSV